MLFKVLPVGGDLAAIDDNGVVHGIVNQVYLIRDNWNDWHDYRTLFQLVVFDEHGDRHSAGGVKIGQVGVAPIFGEYVSPAIPDEFDELGEQFFSVGNRENYYETLFELELGATILRALNDIAASPAIFDRVKDEHVMRRSLLRDLPEDKVTGRFRNITQGNAELTAFDFTYRFPAPNAAAVPLALPYKVEPNSSPPTNIHVLIGRNGVGKTRSLNRMSRALVERDAARVDVGSFLRDGGGLPFANLVSVTFSAFDPFGPLRPPHAIPYAYVGLKWIPRDDEEEPNPAPKSPDDLAEDFILSMVQCRGVARRSRWRAALETLESDPLFAEAGLTELTDNEPDIEDRGRHVYSLLSSGHKIVLLTITRLVEFVDERTLVLLDEPEAHLHPPLLAAFVRALSDLLVKRNGVAIVATHSPVVLQEVPKECVLVLSRAGDTIRADRPERETFGENVGILTAEVFGLEVSRSGFHRLLRDAVNECETYEAVVQHFEQKLGAEARAIARALFSAKRR